MQESRKFPRPQAATRTTASQQHWETHSALSRLDYVQNRACGQVGAGPSAGPPSRELGRTSARRSCRMCSACPGWEGATGQLWVLCTFQTHALTFGPFESKERKVALVYLVSGKETPRPSSGPALWTHPSEDQGPPSTPLNFSP